MTRFVCKSAGLIVACGMLLSALGLSWTAAQEATMVANPKTVIALEKEANATKFAQDALLAYQVFMVDPLIGSDSRVTATTKMSQWQYLAGRNSQRLGGKWYTPKEADKLRSEANVLFDEAIDLLIDKRDADAHKKLIEARVKNPDSPRADFVIGMVYSIGLKDFKRAKEHFEEALRRDPDNAAVLNNLAITEVKLRNPGLAIVRWRTAMQLSDDKRITLNLLRYYDQTQKKKIPIVGSNAVTLANMQKTLKASGRASDDQVNAGWHYIPLGDPTLAPQSTSGISSRGFSQVSSRGVREVIIGEMATGLVVHSEHVLVPLKLAMSGPAFEIRDPVASNQLRLATRVAQSEELGVALLKCPGLQAPPLPLSTQPITKGTEVVVLGCPDSHALDNPLDIERGKITLAPEEKTGGFCLHDKELDTGSAGGPVCNQSGQVIAVHHRSFNFASKMGAAMPASKLVEFVKENVPGYTPALSGGTQQDWPVLESKLARSTLLIRAVMDPQDVSLKGRIEGDPYVDKGCTVCSGRGVVDCPRCELGTIRTTKTVVIARDGNGNEIVRYDPIRVPCGSCERGYIECRACRGSGKDPDAR